MTLLLVLGLIDLLIMTVTVFRGQEDSMAEITASDRSGYAQNHQDTACCIRKSVTFFAITEDKEMGCLYADPDDFDQMMDD